MCFCSKTTICKRANSSTLVFVKVPPTTTFINLLLLEQQLSTHCSTHPRRPGAGKLAASTENPALGTRHRLPGKPAPGTQQVLQKEPLTGYKHSNTYLYTFVQSI